MIDLSFLNTIYPNYKAFILGLGKTGQSVVEAFTSAKIDFLAWDDHLKNSAEKIVSSHYLSPPDDINWTSINHFILSPGISLSHPSVIQAKKHNIPIICDIELFALAQREAFFIGITGSNGKSTTTKLMAHLLKSQSKPVYIGGNIGIPCLSLSPKDEPCIFVLELSSFQLDLIHNSFLDMAILLNISADHIDHHGSFENYCHSKSKIFSLLKKDQNSQAIVGIDDQNTQKIWHSLKEDHIKITTFSGQSNENADLSYNHENYKDNRDVSTSNIKINFPSTHSLYGQQNCQNIAASIYVAYQFGLDQKSVISGLKSFKGLEHRQEYCGHYHNIAFINDSKATNPEAATQALASFDHILWIVGGRSKTNDLECLTPYLDHVMKAFIIGEAAENFIEYLQDHKKPFIHSKTLEQAFEQAFHEAMNQKHENEKDITLLLAPACSSFDQFKNFEERGKYFKLLVQNLFEKGKKVNAQ